MELTSPAGHDNRKAFTAFTRTMDFIRVFSGRPTLSGKMREYISTWFHGTPWHQLKIGNLEEHVARSYFYKSRDEMVASGQGPQLRAMVVEVAELAGVSESELVEGYDPEVKAMWHLQEPLRVSYRPLAFYAVMEGLALASKGVLHSLGFAKGQVPGCTFHVMGLPLPGKRRTASWFSTPPPAPAVPAPAAAAASKGEQGKPPRGSRQLRSHQSAPTPSGNLAAEEGSSGGSSSSRGGSAGVRQQAIAGVEALEPAGESSATGSSQQGSDAPPSPSAVVRQKGPRTLLQRLRGGQGLPGVAAGAEPAAPGTPCPTPSLLPQQQPHASHVRAIPGVSSTGSTTTGGTAARPTDASNPAPPPILFLHGVGVGLLTYLHILAHISAEARASGQAVIVPEFPHVSMRLCAGQEVPTAERAAEGVLAMLDALGVDKVCVVAHSYGTFVASRLVQTAGHRIVSLALIDPVCLAMFMPHLLHSFIYKPPRRDSLWHRVKDHFVRFAAREVHIAATFCRKFYWTSVQLDFELLPDNAMVVLGGCDELLHGEEVAAGLRALQERRAAGAVSFSAQPPRTYTHFTTLAEALSSRQQQQASQQQQPQSQGLVAGLRHRAGSVANTLYAVAQRLGSDATGVEQAATAAAAASGFTTEAVHSMAAEHSSNSRRTSGGGVPEARGNGSQPPAASISGIAGSGAAAPDASPSTPVTAAAGASRVLAGGTGSSTCEIEPQPSPSKELQQPPPAASSGAAVRVCMDSAQDLRGPTIDQDQDASSGAVASTFTGAATDVPISGSAATSAAMRGGVPVELHGSGVGGVPRLMFLPTMAHADFMFIQPFQDMVLQEVTTYTVSVGAAYASMTAANKREAKHHEASTAAAAAAAAAAGAGTSTDSAGTDGGQAGVQPGARPATAVCTDSCGEGSSSEEEEEEQEEAASLVRRRVVAVGGKQGRQQLRVPTPPMRMALTPKRRSAEYERAVALAEASCVRHIL